MKNSQLSKAEKGRSIHMNQSYFVMTGLQLASSYNHSSHRNSRFEQNNLHVRSSDPDPKIWEEPNYANPIGSFKHLNTSLVNRTNSIHPPDNSNKHTETTKNKRSDQLGRAGSEALLLGIHIESNRIGSNRLPASRLLLLRWFGRRNRRGSIDRGRRRRD